MPGDEVEPELIVQSRAGGEVGQVVTDGSHESSEEAGSSKSLNGEVRGDGPSAIRHVREFRLGKFGIKRAQ